MPMIQVTAPSGALTGQGRAEVQREPLRWEGAPETASLRAQAWSHLLEAPRLTASEVPVAPR
ncbi:hypothetical protein AB0K16_57315 [Nonomuraea jabiensis]|uniref:hypothetical protein n=1 Tax=Nonomuraea jabiensis TaxID=882448 RepID=UPI0034428A47